MNAHTRFAEKLGIKMQAEVALDPNLTNKEAVPQGVE